MCWEHRSLAQPCCCKRRGLVHVPGCRQSPPAKARSGGSPNDPRDARSLPSRVRTRTDLRAVTAQTELNIELRLLVSREAN